MTARTKTPALPKSSVRNAGPVSMATLLALAAKAMPDDDTYLGRRVLEAMRPDPAETALDLVDRWITEDRIPVCQKEGWDEEIRHYRRLQAAIARAQKYGIVDDAAPVGAEANAEEEDGYAVAREYFAGELHTLAEQYLKARGDDDGLRAGVLLLYADHTPQVLNEAHTSLRYAIEQEMATTGRVDPQAVTLLWTVAEALENGHAMTFDGVAWGPKA